jgi:sec-independent protein translocase protein TatB
MFDISWSELLILGIVTLIFVGPKELPQFLGTLGRYAGMVRRQAQEFRHQFDEAMREAELDRIKGEVESVSQEVSGSLSDAERLTGVELETAKSDMRALATSAAGESSGGALEVIEERKASDPKPTSDGKPEGGS